MNPLNAVHLPRNWHDALILIVVLTVFTVYRVAVILAKRIMIFSLPKREARFEQKR